MKKTELEIAIDDYLTSKPEMSTDTRVAPFYKRRNVDSLTSPVKKEAAAALSDGEKIVKSVKRKVSKAAEDITNAVTGALT